MKGFIAKLAAGCSLGAGVLAITGCTHYRDIVDPCWPQRYNFMAAQSVRSMHFAQEDKGHVLGQTIWNWHFEPDPKTLGPSATLNGAGMETLKMIARRLPAPDFQIYLQNAQDLPYAANAAPEKIVADRNKLNEKRVAAIQKFLAAQLPPTQGAAVYQVSVHDFTPPSIPGQWTDAAQKNFLTKLLSGTLQNFAMPALNPPR